ncbi:MAG: hypothetical protein GC192_06435 [Bacteroidetes bacterium]|nr:hypothetical protein [Bacteroidota bacterium]
MNSKLFTLVLLLFSFQIFAQNEAGSKLATGSSNDEVLDQQLALEENPEAAFHDEIGINFTRFLDEALDFGGNKTVLSPYLFTYNRLNQDGNGFRFGIGLDISRSKGDITGNFFDDDAKSASSDIDIRLGNMHDRRLSDHWNYYYGFDMVMGYNALNVKSSNAKITNQGMYAGLGPVIGAKLMLTERVGIFTEASFYLVQSFLNEKVDFTNNFETDEKTKSNATNLNFKVPTNIYLFFKF